MSLVQLGERIFNVGCLVLAERDATSGAITLWFTSPVEARQFTGQDAELLWKYLEGLAGLPLKKL